MGAYEMAPDDFVVGVYVTVLLGRKVHDAIQLPIGPDMLGNVSVITVAPPMVDRRGTDRCLRILAVDLPVIVTDSGCDCGEEACRNQRVLWNIQEWRFKRCSPSVVAAMRPQEKRPGREDIRP